MARTDEIDVVAASGLQIQHHGRQFLGGRFAPCPLLADVPVLAELAAQIAAAEENRARAAPAAQHVFFAVDRSCGGTLADPAYRTLNGSETINAAIARAEVAVLQMPAGNTDALLQLTAFKQSQISGLKAVMGFLSGLRR